MAGLGTAVGAAGVFGLRQLSQRTEDLLLSSAVGVIWLAALMVIAGGDVAAGLLLAIGIGLHNIPRRLAIPVRAHMRHAGRQDTG